MKSLKITQKITNRDSSKSLSQYLNEVRNIKPFESADEEYDCAVRAKNGDKVALNELVTKNLKFVISVAKQYSTTKVPLEELVNEGNYGIIEAANKFEPNKGFKFISYAVWYIRKNIVEYLSKNSKQIRIPINKVGSLQKLKKNISELEQLHQRTITANDLIDSGINKDFDLDDINLLLSIDSINIASLDTPFDNDENTNTLLDVIENKDSMCADHFVKQFDNTILINMIMSKLTVPQKMVMTHTFGLNGEKVLNLDEIGDKIDMSRETVRQMRKRTLRILKKDLNDMGINVCDFF